MTEQPAQSELQRQWAQSAELQRLATLNAHVRKTLDRALEALQEGHEDLALTILEEEAAKYKRFGGPDPDPNWAPKTGEER